MACFLTHAAHNGYGLRKKKLSSEHNFGYAPPPGPAPLAGWAMRFKIAPPTRKLVKGRLFAACRTSTPASGRIGQLVVSWVLVCRADSSIMD